jgi:hypothetical protein
MTTSHNQLYALRVETAHPADVPSYMSTMAGLGDNPVQVFATLPDLHWEFLRLWTGFELPSSCITPPLLCIKSESKYFRFYEVASHWPRGTGSQRHSTAKVISKQ